MNLDEIIEKTADYYNPLKYILVAFAVLQLLIVILLPVNFLNSLVLINSLFLYLILPGYSLMLLVREFETIERIVFGIPVGVACVSLTLFLLNMIVGTALSKSMTIGVILFYTLLGLMTRLFCIDRTSIKSSKASETPSGKKKEADTVGETKD
ncbi:hypothetical protein COY95_05235 [Candidatus Woesearchaeota archaeon CG_4_10_14_0_8_um_filter_47_5]|nr:MAG: hypothetical protein COY95_05235 [Candidatus Woesearchaeota archaeon CG_4_10_14_0_8_um_filter_47_5]